MVKTGRAHKKALIFLAVFPAIIGCSLLGSLPAFKDGCYLGTAKAWIDANGNGTRESDEEPLAGVSFLLNDTIHDGNYLFEPVSDENGEFVLSVFPNTCQSLAGNGLVLRATAPAGYTADTPAEIFISDEKLLDSKKEDYSFGFIPATRRKRPWRSMMKAEFQKQYAHTWRVFERLVNDFDDAAWFAAGRRATRPARLSFHILKSTKYYLEDGSEMRFASGKPFETDCEKAPDEALPSRADIADCIKLFAAKTDRWLSAMDYSAKNTAFPWAGETRLGVVIFLDAAQPLSSRGVEFASERKQGRRCGR